MKTRFKAPAKINLTLEIIKKLPNGYHELRSEVLKLDNLYDEVSIDINKNRKNILIRSSSKDIPLDENNICYKAAKKYLERMKKSAGISINIKKSIPVAAGLGGGSSDAAIVLSALNKFYNGLSAQKLVELASEIGKDVPLFLSPKKAIVMSGMGEKIKELSCIPKLFFLIVNPRIVISTKEAYAMISKKLHFLSEKHRTNITNEMEKALRNNKIRAIAKNMHNDFEMVIEKKHPEIREIKCNLLALEARGALMSGSGSSVFGMFDSKLKASKAAKYFKKNYPDYITRIG